MQTRSAEYVAQITQSHTVHARADLLVGGSPALENLAVLDGTVTLDPDAEHRGSLTATLLDTTGTLTPATAEDALASFAAELAPRRGIRLASGTLETFDLGIYGIDTLEVAESRQGLTLQITAFDRSKQVARNSWDQIWPIPAGSPVEVAGRDLLDNRRPGLSYELESSGHLTTLMVFGDRSESNPWADARRVFASAGQDLYFDRAGAARAASPGSNNVLAAEFVEGPNCTVTDLARQFSSAEVYNGVIVIGENAAANLRATVWDEDPSSPTYYLGPFGRRPRTITTSKARTADQAAAIARLHFHRLAGRADQIQINTVPDPSLDPGDLVLVRRARAAVDGIYRIRRTEIPLRHTSTMSITATLATLTA